MREFLLQYILPPQQSVKAHAESVGYSDDLDIGHEAFAALNALNGVFVYIKAGKLERIGESPIFLRRKATFFPQILFSPSFALLMNIKQPPRHSVLI